MEGTNLALRSSFPSNAGHVTRGGATATSTTDFTVTGAPTITSFSPTNGPVGTSVTINGTGLAGVTSVKFGDVAAVTFSVNGAGTRVTAKVPNGAVTGKITVTTPGGTATSASDFTVTTAPSITSFTPTSGPVGTVVTINGSAFTGATSVKFGGRAATTFSVNSATKITATVPAGAVSGKITVTTPSGSGTSSTSFTVEPTFHGRSISIALRRHLVVRGAVTAAGEFDACAAGVPVRIQRRVEGAWRTIARTLTGDLGGYRVRVADRSGRYRTVAPRVEMASDVCGRAVSRVAINA